ncbi:hypothetical protein [Coprobacter tertius]|uniref:Fimbrillin-A associated anchor proteins Mfa1 and Mfa2 n=1 Tax=Coprobacter tertius TaxID=2944915 RepID=A0ABT1MHR7_9BACT|nr:hypothetical protein [Coprobacter tertius]MCP9612184.1 hypothetical protein [Coprobacter tertius]
MNTKIFFALLPFIGIIYSCVHEDLDKCKTADVVVNVYVEKFGASTLSPEDSEANFKTRIKKFRYFFYKDGVLQKQGIVSDFISSDSPYYIFSYSGLDPGDYRLIVIANCDDDVLSGDPSDIDKYLIVYPGVDKCGDYFALNFPFTINCDCDMRYNAYLQRLHSVVNFSFSQIPSYLTALEISLDNVGLNRFMRGDYNGHISISKRIMLQEMTKKNIASNLLVGVYPTLPNEYATYKLKAFTDNADIPCFEAVIKDNLPLIRNQLLHINTSLNNDLDFTVTVDTRWDGSINGGETDLN